MIAPGHLFETLRGHGVRFFAGVPDSLLKHFCAHVTRETAPGEHVIAANEGAAVALAAGHYLATGRPALVYMQNSGQGNAVNPLVSLASPDIVGIPMLLMIGWRGEPGVPDEPQHLRQGRCTPDVMTAIGLPWQVLPQDEAGADACVAEALAQARQHQVPVGILVRDKTFAPVAPVCAPAIPGAPTREAALTALVDAIPPGAAVVCTTGMASRELFEIRQARGGPYDGDFRVVGSMGHASQIALGLALADPARPVVCLDGDGAVIMHLGSLAVIGVQHPPNLLHVVLNNGAHDSVGAQPTAGLAIDLCGIARACGYASARRAGLDDLSHALAAAAAGSGPGFVEIVVTPGARSDLGRPTETPCANKRRLMQFLQSAPPAA